MKDFETLMAEHDHLQAVYRVYRNTQLGAILLILPFILLATKMFSTSDSVLIGSVLFLLGGGFTAVVEYKRDQLDSLTKEIFLSVHNKNK